MTSPDDEIVAALRQSPGDPPSGDLFAKVADGARRRTRRRHVLTAAGSTMCVIAALAIVPVLLSGRADHPTPGVANPAPSTSNAAPTLSCAGSLDDVPTPTRRPPGSGFVPGTPSSAMLCEYATSSETATKPLLLAGHVEIRSGELETLVGLAHRLEPSNGVASCPPPQTADVVLFGYASGATVSVQIACAMIWQSDDVHMIIDGAAANSFIDAVAALRPAAAPSTSAPATNADQSPIPGGGTVLELSDSMEFSIVNLATGVPRRVDLAGVPGGPSFLATNPAGGWVVTYTPDASPQWGEASSQLAIVDESGDVQPFGPTYPSSSPITGLAVSPDGSRVAIALMKATGNAATASIVVLPMPGHAGTAQVWSADDPLMNELESLSWAPDGKRLSYIAGMQTGAGIAGNPSTLDTSKPGKAPTRSSWNVEEGHCPPIAASWLGTSGGFAVVGGCLPNDSFVRVDGETGQAITTLPLSGSGCNAAEIHSSADGSRVLVARCLGVDLISDGGITRLGAHIIDAAWAG